MNDSPCPNLICCRGVGMEPTTNPPHDSHYTRIRIRSCRDCGAATTVLDEGPYSQLCGECASKRILDRMDLDADR